MLTDSSVSLNLLRLNETRRKKPQSRGTSVLQTLEPRAPATLELKSLPLLKSSLERSMATPQTKRGSQALEEEEAGNNPQALELARGGRGGGSGEEAGRG
jgi:hypothetical protein